MIYNYEKLMLTYVTIVVATYQYPYVFWYNYLNGMKNTK